MAAKKRKDDDSSTMNFDDITNILIKDLNKEMGSLVAYNLSCDDAPTNVKRWLTTSSIQFDYAIRNDDDGGVPEGRIIEISGLPSTGKSHIAFQLAVTTQRLGGIVIYIDTENAVPLTKLKNMGIDVSRNFIYCDTHCTEEVFHIIESTIEKIKPYREIGKKYPVLVVWDSVAATSPKAELEGDYDQSTMGLQARTISKAMRKITGVIGHNDVTFICLNQLRQDINAGKYGDPWTTPGGQAIPYHASLRVKLTSGTPVYDKAGNVIGIKVIVKIIKNKVAPPFRKFEFKIIFGKGIDESEELFDVLNDYHKKNGELKFGNTFISCSGDGAWKTFLVRSEGGEVILEKKFYKQNFTSEVISKPELRELINPLLRAALTVNSDNSFSETELESEDKNPETDGGGGE